MEEPLVTYALWGTGELAPENATALLEEYVPDNVGTVYRPVEVGRDKPGLRNALDWFESPDFLGDGGAVPSTDLVQSLLDDRANNGDEVYLLALWPEVPQHEDFDFIQTVQNSGITVIDLSRAWTELDLTLFSRPEPTAEEKAEAKAAAKAERAPRTRKKLSDDVPEQETLPLVVPEKAMEATEAPASSTFLAENLFVALKAYIDEQIQLGIKAAIASAGITIVVGNGNPVDVPVEDRPPFDPPYVGEDTKAYFVGSTGKYRPADGKPRRGEIVINMTDDEAREKGAL